MKLQKLLFYVKAWGLVANEHITNASFEKWDYGPVNRGIYQKFKQHGSNPIELPCENFSVLAPAKKVFVDFVVENYIDFHAFALSAMTHEEDPWKNASNGDVISNEEIKAYYATQWFAKNFPLKPDQPFYPVMSDIEHSFVFDMTPEDAELSMTFPSYAYYKALKDKTKKELMNNWLKKLG